MKVVFVIPVYNDWDSLKILSEQIKEISVREKWRETELIIVNDGSTQELKTSPNPFALKSTVLNLFSNQGNQKAITIGLSYINEQIPDYDYIIIMDADGEDKPSDAVNLINECKKLHENLKKTTKTFIKGYFGYLTPMQNFKSAVRTGINKCNEQIKKCSISRAEREKNY